MFFSSYKILLLGQWQQEYSFWVGSLSMRSIENPLNEVCCDCQEEMKEVVSEIKADWSVKDLNLRLGPPFDSVQKSYK